MTSPTPVAKPPQVIAPPVHQGGAAPGPSTPRSFLLQTSLHWTFLVLSLLVVAAAMSMTVRDGDRVIVPIIDKPLPGSCTFLRLTGVPCPGCGMTRAFISFAHGRLDEAWKYNPAGFLFFGIVAFQIPYRIFQIFRIRRGLGEHHFARVDRWILLALVAILIVQWFFRVAWQLL